MGSKKARQQLAGLFRSMAVLFPHSSQKVLNVDFYFHRGRPDNPLLGYTICLFRNTSYISDTQNGMIGNVFWAPQSPRRWAFTPWGVAMLMSLPYLLLVKQFKDLSLCLFTEVN